MWTQKLSNGWILIRGYNGEHLAQAADEHSAAVFMRRYQSIENKNYKLNTIVSPEAKEQEIDLSCLKPRNIFEYILWCL